MGDWPAVLHDHSQADEGVTLRPSGLYVPSSAGAAPTEEGKLEWDSDDNLLKVGDGSTTKTFRPEGAIGCKLRRVATQTINNAVQTTISWDTEDADTDGFIAVTSTTVTIPSGLGGHYSILLKVSLSASAGTAGYLNMFDGALNHRFPFPSGQTTGTCATAGVTCADAGALTFSALHTNGSNLTMTAWLGLYRVGDGI